jgi:pilus assembly protein CpaF
VAAVFPPCSVHGATLTIRRFGTGRLTLDDLEQAGTVAGAQPDVLVRAMARLDTVLISAGTGSGKTTLLNALAELLPDDDRLVVIEDIAELRLSKPNLVRFDARRAQPDLPAVTMRDLVRAALRHRPDRSLIGEVRGAARSPCSGPPPTPPRRTASADQILAAYSAVDRDVTQTS